MIKKYLAFKGRQSAGKRWLLCFTERFLLLSLAFFVFEYVDIFRLGQTWSVSDILFRTSFIAFFWTLFSDWKEAKAIFIKDQSVH